MTTQPHDDPATFAVGDTVSKINSRTTDKIQDGKIGIVTDLSPRWVCVLFVGLDHDLLVRSEQVELKSVARPTVITASQWDTGNEKLVIYPAIYNLMNDALDEIRNILGRDVYTIEETVEAVRKLQTTSTAQAEQIRTLREDVHIISGMMQQAQVALEDTDSQAFSTTSTPTADFVEGVADGVIKALTNTGYEPDALAARNETMSNPDRLAQLAASVEAYRAIRNDIDNEWDRHDVDHFYREEKFGDRLIEAEDALKEHYDTILELFDSMAALVAFVEELANYQPHEWRDQWQQGENAVREIVAEEARDLLANLRQPEGGELK